MAQVTWPGDSSGLTVFPDFPGNGSNNGTNFPGISKNRAFCRGNRKALAMVEEGEERVVWDFSGRRFRFLFFLSAGGRESVAMAFDILVTPLVDQSICK